MRTARGVTTPGTLRKRVHYPILVALFAGLGAMQTGYATDVPTRLAAPTAAESTDRLIVSFSRGSREFMDPRALAATLDTIGRERGIGLSRERRLGIGADLVRLDRAMDRAGVEQLMRRLGAQPGVDYVELDAKVRALALPNDPLYPDQAEYYGNTGGGINLPQAWQASTGSGVVVAVIDTGSSPHSDLAPNFIGGYDFIADANGGDGNGRDPDPTDPSNFHGTHVAGTIAAVANNANGVAGVAYGARILPLRVLGVDGTGYTSNLVDAITWARGGAVSGVPANPYPADVINLSLGVEGGCTSSEQVAINAAIAAGTVVVVAAGNSAKDTSGFSPANCAGVIAVAAVDRAGELASFSNFGSTVDVAAPGVSVLSTTYSGPPFVEAYLRSSGTSMAAPHVAATVALMQAARVSSPAEVESILKATSRTLPLPCPGGCGAGVIDAGQAVAGALAPRVYVQDVLIAEGNSGTKTAAVTVALSRAASVPVSFDLVLAGGTATPGVDFTFADRIGEVMAAGTTSRTYDVVLIGDASLEPNESIALSVENLSGAGPGDIQSSLTVLNDDAPVLSVSDATIEEGNSGYKYANFRIELSQPTTTAVGFTVATANGTATAASDYAAVSPAPITIEAGKTAIFFSVSVLGDTTAEANESFFLNIGNVAGATVGDAQGLGNIINDDGLTLRVFDAQIGEGDTGTSLLTFSVQLSAASTSPVTYTVETVDGTASAASGDYAVLAPVTRTFSPGQTTHFTTVAIAGDAQAEQNETFIVRLSNAGGATLRDPEAVGTVLNDDGPVLSIADISIIEGDAGYTQAVFTISLSEPAMTNVTYDVATYGSASDFLASTMTGETIPSGQTTRTFAVSIIGDQEVESNELVRVDLSNATGASIYDSYAYGTILNDDGPTLSVDDVSIIEGNSGSRTATVSVRLSEPSANTVSFSLSTSQITASEAVDYAYFGGSYSMPAGVTSKSLDLVVYGDTAVEANESFGLNLTSSSGATQLKNGVITIVNDDGPTLSVSDAALVEGNSGYKLVTFTVTSSQAVPSPISFDIGTSDGSATSGSDYTARSLSGLSIPAGSLTRNFSVNVVGETAVEANEAFFVNLTNVNGATVSDGQGKATILNDDGPTLSITDVSVAEGNSGTKALTFTVQLSKTAAGPVTYAISTANGSAASGSDYVAKSATGETIAAGQLTRTFSVTINGDAAIEPNETVLVNLSTASGATIQDELAVGTLLNDDGARLSIDDININEGHSGTRVATFTVSLPSTSANAVTYDIATIDQAATAGSDYAAKSLAGQTIPAGQLSRTFTVTINGDTTVEPSEDFRVTIGNAVGASIFDAQGVGTIVNDDGALISINDVAVGEGNAGTKVMTFTVSLSQAAPGPVAYNISTQGGDATSGVDYAALDLAGQTIPAGQLSKLQSVTIYGDTAIEPTEVVEVYVRQPVGASVLDGHGNGYILNDDGPTLSVLDASVGEGNSGSKMMNVTVLLSQASANPVNFAIASSNVSATAGSDYTALNLVDQTIPAGQTSKVFQILVAGDSMVEQNETFFVTLAPNPVGATLYDRQAIATIYNDDGPTLSINDVSIAEGNSGTKVMTFNVSLSQAAAAAVTYNVATSNLTATAGSDYVARSLVGESIPAGQTSKTFSVTLNGDTTVEANETFRIALSNISANATLFKFTGTGTINNDD